MKALVSALALMLIICSYQAKTKEFVFALVPKDAKYPQLRLAYVGSNNFALGRALGQQLMARHPQGGNIVIQSGRPDSHNLSLRIQGLRSALAGRDFSLASAEILDHDNGWHEVRAPFPSYGRIPRALKQMEKVLKTDNIAAFVAVGGWAQLDDGAYRHMIYPLKNKLINNEISVVMADTVDSQLALLNDKLSHVNIGQSPFDMGKMAILTLYQFD